jgi:hypothetical protein
MIADASFISNRIELQPLQVAAAMSQDSKSTTQLDV